MNDAAKFAVHCKMTCLGGSEKGTCTCARGEDCVVQFDEGYEEARAEAMTRMLRHVRAKRESR